MKWRAASGVLCDRRIPLKLKGKFYRVAIRPAMLYGSECWPITKAQANRVEVAELRMLRWTCGKTMVDMIPNGVFRAELDVDSIIDKMREGRLRWFGHVKRRPETAPVRRVEAMLVEGSRRRGRPKLRWEDRLKQDMKELLYMTSDRNAWRDRIRISGCCGLLCAGMLVCPACAVCRALVPGGRGRICLRSPPPYPASAGLGMLLLLLYVEVVQCEIAVEFRDIEGYWDLRQQTPVHTQQIPNRCYALSVKHPLMVVGTADRNLIAFNLQNQKRESGSNEDGVEDQPDKSNLVNDGDVSKKDKKKKRKRDSSKETQIEENEDNQNDGPELSIEDSVSEKSDNKKRKFDAQNSDTQLKEIMTEESTPERQSYLNRQSFSGHVEVFPLSDTGPENQTTKGDGLIRVDTELKNVGKKSGNAYHIVPI
ncbi:polyprotein [Tanacetum coccineum]